MHRKTWNTRTEMKLAVAAWVGWYNRCCIHQTLGVIPPAEYEANHYAAITPTWAGART